MKKKRGQIGTEYMVIMTFLVFIIIGVLGVGFYYLGSTRDQMASMQISSFAESIISASERVYYEGEPSKATIEVYIPQEVINVSIIDDNIVVLYTTEEGEAKIAFASDVPINGTIPNDFGVKKILIVAKENNVEISPG